MSERHYFWLMGGIFILVITLPYLLGFISSGEEVVFGGFLLNPIDGQTYAAKIFQGIRGEWRFRLPYTSDPGEGAYLFLYYLLLGHLARIFSISPHLVFHIARVLSSLGLVWAVSRMVLGLFEDNAARKIAFAAILFGSGLGWIAVILGLFTSDFWVAEAYPFLSAYANPHFPLGLGLMVLLLDPDQTLPAAAQGGMVVCLAIIQPFGALLVLVIRTGYFLADLLQMKNKNVLEILRGKEILALGIMGMGGGGVLLYQYLAIIQDPVLRIWNQQNTTPTPTWIDFLFSFSPCLILAGAGAPRAWQQKKSQKLLLWGGLSLLLLLTPWRLQRRFITGLFVPLAGLAVFGLDQIRRISKVSFRTLAAIFFLLIIPTNSIVLLSGWQAIQVRDSQVFISRDFYDCMAWINENTRRDALVIADSHYGLYIPAFTGRRVIYGHPFETIFAEREEQLLEELYQGVYGAQTIQEIIEKRRASYLLVDQSVPGSQLPINRLKGQLVFEQGSLQLYRVHP